MQKINEIYSGKAKTLFNTENEKYLIVHFRDDITAFNAEKKSRLQNKGKVNNLFNAFIMEKLEHAGIPTHFEEVLNEKESLVKHLQMIPLECVVRNITAGSLCKRYNIAEGMDLNPPLFEFFLKNDQLGDPLVNINHIRAFKWASDDEVATMQNLSYKVNDILKPLFFEAGMFLVDYKLEFGRFDGNIVLGDEFTPDGCRIWDVKTREKLDKDRFRNDLGDVIEAYEHVAHRLGLEIQ
jgi:phosphoribosylaminoimidazole-succinocarboxamide synthase